MLPSIIVSSVNISSVAGLRGGFRTGGDAAYNTAKLLKDSVELDISGLSVDYESGSEQLASRAEFDEIDAVVYLRDGRLGFNTKNSDLLDVCDINNIPYSTNIATAEMLILAIDRGDLDYRAWKKE